MFSEKGLDGLLDLYNTTFREKKKGISYSTFNFPNILQFTVFSAGLDLKKMLQGTIFYALCFYSACGCLPIDPSLRDYLSPSYMVKV